MKGKIILLFTLLFCTKFLAAQSSPEINVKFSRLYATYEFVQKLSGRYPGNVYKKAFEDSRYYTQKYIDLIQQWDTLKIYETYQFRGYPIEQKIPGITTNILKKNLIRSTDLNDFKTRSFGIIPSAELFALTTILENFAPVYDELIYLQNQQAFDEKVQALSAYVANSPSAVFFQAGLDFYRTAWDYSVPFEIVIVPSLSQGGFTATTFLNYAVSEVPVDFDSYDILLSVLMHEIYHILYDEQPLTVKADIRQWFSENNSPGSRYAFLLLNEVLATALGNGFVYEQLKGEPDEDDWYNNKYINEMARKIYPVVTRYLNEKRPIDRDFVNAYLAVYDQNFPEWRNELDHILTYRYTVGGHPDDPGFFSRNYPHTSVSYTDDEFTLCGLEQMKERPVTKIVLVSQENARKLDMVRSVFPELKDWAYQAGEDFVYTTDLRNRTKLIIVNAVTQTTDQLLEKSFPHRKIE